MGNARRNPAKYDLRRLRQFRSDGILNDMIRQYGTPPFRVAVVHGGPGGIGSAGGLAEGLSASCGVLEPLQSKYSIPELIAELHEQLAVSPVPLTLIGHSWGAWLAALYAVEFPQLVTRLVLVCCPPFEARYVPQIGARRAARLNAKERKCFRTIIAELDKNGDSDRLGELGELCGKADNHAPLPDLEEPPSQFNGDMYAKVWNEADAMRKSGELLRRAEKLTTPITVIHGDCDPHPPEGVTEPLQKANIPFTFHLLPQCGHSPWCETYARDAFFALLQLP